MQNFYIFLNVSLNNKCIEMIVDAVHSLLSTRLHQTHHHHHATTTTTTAQVRSTSCRDIVLLAISHACRALFRALYAILCFAEDVFRFLCILFLLVPGLACLFLVLGVTFYVPSIISAFLSRNRERTTRLPSLEEPVCHAVN